MRPYACAHALATLPTYVGRSLLSGQLARSTDGCNDGVDLHEEKEKEEEEEKTEES